MNRRQVLKATGLGAMTLLAGCDKEREPEETPTPGKTDNGIRIWEVREYESGERNCYHEVHANVRNELEKTVSPKIGMTFYKENGQKLMEFDVEFRSIDPGEKKEIVYEQQMPCFTWYRTDDYYTIDIETTEVSG